MTELARDEEFSAFVLARRPELLRSACLLTAGDWHSAEDLVQTALAKLYVAWPRVRRTGTQVGYAWRILVNTHIDEVRRPRWRREHPVAAPPDTPDPGALAAFPDGLGGGAVRAALAGLPPGMRAAVVLRHWADFSVEETAQILGCSAGTVKSQTAKGITRLRELLGDADPASATPGLRDAGHGGAGVGSTGVGSTGLGGTGLGRTNLSSTGLGNAGLSNTAFRGSQPRG